MSTIGFAVGRATLAQIIAHLSACDLEFRPPLSSRVDIGGYAGKIFSRAARFEAHAGQELTGLVAAYWDTHHSHTAFITNVSVSPGWQGRGLGSTLLRRCLASARDVGVRRVELDVGADHAAAIALYRKCGFVAVSRNAELVRMSLDFEREKQMIPQRNYDVEIRDTADHQYAYNFDFDVMHPYMMRSFEPFFRHGSVLELGSFKGDFSRRLLERFDDVTCVEASEQAIEEARRKFGERIGFVHSTFELARLPRRYDNIVITHVLEHLDDPVRVLKRINDEWLADDGRLFLVCPNANAPSRQIAVKMGLISHNSAVTPAEAAHGHRCTYSLDVLERDAVAAGLRVVHRSGIFFKALANFQWDRLLQTDIISKEYLDGCFQLGQQYPDLCSSIFLLCERGKSGRAEDV